MEESLSDKIDKTNKLLEQMVIDGKAKTFKLKGLPSKSKVKKNYIYVLFINENGVLEPLQTQIEELTTYIKDAPRFLTPDYLISYKGLPAIIQPAWSIEPLSIKKNFEETERLKTIAVGRRLIANRLEKGVLTDKKKISGLVIFFIVIAVLVAGYFLLFR